MNFVLRVCGISLSVVCVASLVLLQAGCSPPEELDTVTGEVERDARERAYSEPQLERYARALRAAGWSIASKETSTVEFLHAPVDPENADDAYDAQLEWTRVRVAATKQNGENGQLSGELVVAWNDQTDAIVVVDAHDGPAREELMAQIATEAPSEQDPLDLIASREEALSSCGGYGSACGDASKCCEPFKCTESKDNHQSCWCDLKQQRYVIATNCRHVPEISRSDCSAAFTACFQLWDNPVGAHLVYVNKIGCGSGLGPDACGKSYGTYSYVQRQWYTIQCMPAPANICSRGIFRNTAESLPTRPAASPQPQASCLSSTLRRGSSGEAVRRAQQLLREAGYTIDVDGEYGPMTVSVVKQFQEDNGLAQDGVLGPNSATKLCGRTSKPIAATAAPVSSTCPSRTLRAGSSGTDVRSVQQLLRDRGYTIDVDGKYGPMTASVVKQFQIDHGLTADGVLGPMTAAKLCARN